MREFCYVTHMIINCCKMNKDSKFKSKSYNSCSWFSNLKTRRIWLICQKILNVIHALSLKLTKYFDKGKIIYLWKLWLQDSLKSVYTSLVTLVSLWNKRFVQMLPTIIKKSKGFTSKLCHVIVLNWLIMLVMCKLCWIYFWGFP